jgi:hypothetical protein
MIPSATTPTSLIGKCLRHIRGKHLTEYLQGYAEDVVIAARIMGPRAAGDSLGKEIIGKAISPTPIITIVAMVESGEIPMTRERLKAVVDQDEGAMLFYARNPWIIDPTGKSAPPVKKGRKPSNPPMSETNEKPKTPSTSPKKKEPRAKTQSAALPEPKNSKTEKKVDDEKTPDEIPSHTAAPPWKILSQQESENQRQAFEPKKPEPKPPVFRGTSAPSMTASEEEREEWRKLRKKEIAEFIFTERSKGWEIPSDWDGLKPAATVAKWIDSPSV